MDKTKHGRRQFLIVAGATGAAAVAAIGARTAPQPAQTAPKDDDKRAGYRLTEHIRNYYRTTLV